MANVMAMMGLLVYIIGVTITVGMITNTAVSTDAIGVYLPHQDFMIDNDITGLGVKAHFVSGSFNTSVGKGLYATALDGSNFASFNNYAECEFGNVPINNSQYNMKLWLKGMLVNPHYNFFVLLAHVNNQQDKTLGIYSDKYYWLQFNNGKIFVRTESYLDLPIANMIPTVSFSQPIGTYNKDSFNVTMNYNYNNNLLAISIDDIKIGSQIVNINNTDVTSGVITSMPFNIRVDNYDMSILSCYQYLKGMQSYSTNWWDYVPIFFKILVWGLPDTILEWWAHILFITIPELAFIYLLATNLLRGD